MTINPLVIEGAAVPGQPDSYYSAEKTLATAGGGAKTLVPEVGWIMTVPTADVSYLIQTVDSPATYVTLIAANTAGMIWSDGTNIFTSKSSGGAGSAKYFVVGHKP